MKFNKAILTKIGIFTLAAANLTGTVTPVLAAEKTQDQTELGDSEKQTSVSASKVTEAKNVFEDADEDIVFVKNAVGKDKADESGVVVTNFEIGTEGTLTGTNNYGNWRIEVDGETYYVNQHNFEIVEKPVSTYNTSWTGPVLTRSAGVVYGPTGKETYYNLNMSGVIATMRAMGNTDEYWVREDGVKMLGNYVMVAANLSVFPRGSLVPCSLGTGIVCDTGGFAAANPYQLDIATTW
jgi:3D (Asp-Asp-Asp) domain-containing protein